MQSTILYLKMEHYKQLELEGKLRTICDRVDDLLEDKFGDSYRLHPNRPLRGRTANKAYDGLFNVTSTFTPGYGSESGKGYLVNINLATLQKIPGEFKEEVFLEAIEQIKLELKRVFPDRELKIFREGNILKILGDFSLGPLY